MLFDEAETYLNRIGDWVDPNPEPIIVQHEGFTVVRDDLLGAGTKVRGLDYLIGHAPEYKNIREWVFGSCPATGYAQISLPTVCSRYDKRAVLFMAKRDPKNFHPYQKLGIRAGTDYRWVPNGMLNVTQARAREYAEESPETRKVLPLGLEHPYVTACFIKVARSLPAPKEFWTVGSSGSLNRALQLAWPDADAHVVSVGHKMKEHEIGRAKYYRSDLKFHKAVLAKDEPPFPSAPTYDAKAWKFVREHASPGALFWNVGA